MNQPKVIVIILNWNGYEDTLACLASLDRTTYPNTKVVVIDNQSTAQSYQALAQAMASGFPQATLIRASENLGFTGGNNMGLQLAAEQGADYALLLNNDTEVEADFLDQLVAAAEANPRIAAAGPTIYYHARPEVIWSAGGSIDWWRGDSAMIGLGEIERGQYGDQPRPVDFVTGCAMLVSMACVNEIGALDERFFAYYEETEWCARATRAGYRVYHVPAARVWHKISPEAREASPSVHYYMTRNRLLFLRLTHASRSVWVRALFVEYGLRLLSWSVKPVWRHKKEQRRAVLRAIYDFSRGQFGPLTS